MFLSVVEKRKRLKESAFSAILLQWLSGTRLSGSPISQSKARLLLRWRIAHRKPAHRDSDTDKTPPNPQRKSVSRRGRSENSLSQATSRRPTARHTHTHTRPRGLVPSDSSRGASPLMTQISPLAMYSNLSPPLPSRVEHTKNVFLPDASRTKLNCQESLNSTDINRSPYLSGPSYVTVA